jgi:hypothetical protein
MEQKKQARPEWQTILVGWKLFVESRPELGLKINKNAYAYFMRKHKNEMLEKGVVKRINGCWMAHTEKFQEAVFDALLSC